MTDIFDKFNIPPKIINSYNYDVKIDDNVIVQDFTNC
jgi:hypothetical protein